MHEPALHKIITLDVAGASAALENSTQLHTGRSLIQVKDHRGNPVEGIYTYPGEKGFYIRPRVDRRSKTRKLKATTVSAAKKERAKLVGKLSDYHAGMAPNPFAKVASVRSVHELCKFYLDKNCPRKNTVKERAGQDLVDEQKRVATLMLWPGARGTWKELTAEHWRQYAAWRKNRIRSGKGGDRQIDKERITLSNVFRCAIRHKSETGVDKNPVIDAEFETFRDADKVKHCRDHMPETGDELHNISSYAFNSGLTRRAVTSKSPRGTKGTRHWQLQNEEVMGWITLFGGAVGHRIAALLTLRTDAQNKSQPGYVADKKLYLFQSESSKGTFGYREIDRDLKACMEVHRAWLQLRFPGSLWYFPSPLDPSKPVTPGAYTRWLARVCPAMGLPHRTAQGLRSFRVNVLRSEGLSLEEAAIRVGHRSLGKLILSTYGKALDYKLTWMPQNRRPAWEDFNARINPQLELEFGYRAPQGLATQIPPDLLPSGKSCPPPQPTA
jgi:hypothetical protein